MASPLSAKRIVITIPDDEAISKGTDPSIPSTKTRQPHRASDNQSPIVIDDDPPPRYIQFNHKDKTPLVVDLEKDDEDGFNQDDYVSDDELDRLFPKHSGVNPVPSSSRTKAPAATQHRSAKGIKPEPNADTSFVLLSSVQSKECTYEAGKSTAEIGNGDFFHVKEIRQYANHGVFVRGHRLRRGRDIPGVENKRNELVLMLRMDRDNPRDSMDQGMEEHRLELLGTVRELVFTNRRYPRTSHRDDPASQGRSVYSIMSTGRLFCRQKHITTFNTTKHRAAGRASETCLQFLAENEADEGASDRHDRLRQDFRGDTIKGGACPDFLEGERGFDQGERQAVQDFKAFSRPPSRLAHTSIADHTIGRNAAPSTPARRQFHQQLTPGSRDDPITLGDDSEAPYRMTIDLSDQEDTRLHLQDLSLQTSSTSRKRLRRGSSPSFPPTPPSSRRDSSTNAKRQRIIRLDDTPIPFSLRQSQDTLRPQHIAKMSLPEPYPCSGLPSTTEKSRSETSMSAPSPSRRQPGSVAFTHQQRYTFGDSFCGAGGASRGAKMAGLRVSWGNDFDPAAINSYKLNFWETQCEAMWAHDFIRVIMGEDHKVDMLHLSPPCQVFSPAHTTEGKDDEMNTETFFAIQMFLKKARPRIATMENTFGLIQDWPDYLEAAVGFFTSLGYSVRWKISNFAEYGLPQSRRRAFFIASCPGEPLPEFPPPTHSGDPEKCRTLGLKPFVSVNDAILQIPAGFPNHEPKEGTKACKAYDGNRQLPRAITCGGGQNYHPSGKRDFTNREFACLQGFPLEHKFGKTRVKKQIGNAVPPSVAKVIFGHLKESLLKADGLR